MSMLFRELFSLTRLRKLSIRGWERIRPELRPKLRGINTFPKEPPRDALGNLNRIEILRDRGEENRLGAL